MSNEPKIHFNSIDALRFFAFFKIFLSHIPLQAEFPLFSFLKSGGGIGVTFFFVLSGFLITFLLCNEKKQKGTIDLKRFFIRRSLRIWPLFFLWVIIAYALPYSWLEIAGFHMVGGGYQPEWQYSFTFLENYKMLAEDNFPKTTPLPVFWSLCIEEQFYLLWMIAIFTIPYSHILKFLLIAIPVAWLARFTEPYIFNNGLIINNDLFTNIDLFAIGGVLGYYVSRDFHRVSDFINNIHTKIKMLILISVLVMVLFQKQLFCEEPGNWWFIIQPTIQGICFTTLIAIVIPKHSKIRFKNSNPFSFLGKISYGLYVYHIILIHLIFQYCINAQVKIDNVATLSLFIFITLGLSILISFVSYQYFEMPFLRLRNKLFSST